MEKSRCVFCERASESKMTREHLWGKWMGNILDATDKQYFFRRNSQEGKLLKEWNSPLLDLKARVVCNECNNGWMHDLENEAQSVIKGMIQSRIARILDPRSLAIIGTFTFKTALIADCMLPEGQRRFFSFATRRQFAESLLVPNDIQMWIAGLRREDVTRGLWRPQYKLIGELRQGCQIYIFTFVVGCLALQLISSTWSDSSRNSIPIFEQSHLWDPTVFKFWPLTGSSINWPSFECLSNDQINTFSHRWAKVLRPHGNANLFISL